MESQQANESLLELITLLREVDQNPKPFEAESGGYDMYHPTIEKIIVVANDYLTVGANVLLHRNMMRLAGYPVYPGEVDRFGWLTAYFQMKEGIILFG